MPDRTVYSDVGSEASAYRGNSFSRTPTLEGSFEPTSFRWSSTTQWEAADPNSQLMQDFERYVAIHPLMVPTEEEVAKSQDERRQQLQALGYIEAGEEEEKPEPR